MKHHTVGIVECGPRVHAFVRRRASWTTLRDAAVRTPVWTRKLELGLKGTGLATIIYPDGARDDLLTGGEFEVLLGAELVSPFADDVILSCGQTPLGRAATARYTGPREGAPAVHNAIRRWCADEGRALAGPVWELHYWVENPVERYADIFYMLA